MTSAQANTARSEAATLPMMYRDSCRRHADRAAIIAGDTRLSYAQLWRAASDVAKGLLSRDLGPGARVAIWAPNSWQWLVAATAVSLAGCVLVPVNTRFKRTEAVHILANAGVEAVLLSDEFVGIDYAGMLFGPSLNTSDPPGPSNDARRLIADLPRVSSVVMLSGSPRPGASTLEELISQGRDVADSTLEKRWAAVRPDSVCDITFTSGTTGLPKGARSKHATVLAAYRSLSDVVGLVGDDRYLIVNPLFHAFGYRAGWLSCVLRGAAALPVARFDVDNILATVQRERITVLPGTPTVFQSILDSGAAAHYDLSTLRLSITGAMTTSALLIERMHAELGFDSVVTGYGLTEHCGVATMCRPNDDFSVRTATSGRVIPGAEVKIIAASGAVAEPGIAGEILVRGYVMEGYHANSEATSAAIDADGWLHTTDIGQLRPDGNLVIVGRLSDMFIVGGFNVYPAEVEARLARHPAVGDVAVIGVPDARMGEVGYAFVVARTQPPPPEADLIAWCREELSNFKTPRVVRYVTQLPRTANGKVRTDELRALAALAGPA